MISTNRWIGIEKESAYSWLDDVFRACAPPVNLCRILFGEDGDVVLVDDELVVLCLYGTGKFAMDRVVLEHVDHVFKRDEGALQIKAMGQWRLKKIKDALVDSDDIDLVIEEGITKDDTADTT